MHEHEQIDTNAYKVPIEQVLVNCGSQALLCSILQRTVSSEPKIYIFLLDWKAVIAYYFFLAKSKFRIQ